MIRDEFNQIEVTNDKQLLHTEFGKTQKAEFSPQQENKLPEGDLNEKYVGKTIRKETEVNVDYINKVPSHGAQTVVTSTSTATTVGAATATTAVAASTVAVVAIATVTGISVALHDYKYEFKSLIISSNELRYELYVYDAMLKDDEYLSFKDQEPTREDEPYDETSSAPFKLRVYNNDYDASQYLWDRSTNIGVFSNLSLGNTYNIVLSENRYGGEEIYKDTFVTYVNSSIVDFTLYPYTDYVEGTFDYNLDFVDDDDSISDITLEFYPVDLPRETVASFAIPKESGYKTISALDDNGGQLVDLNSEWGYRVSYIQNNEKKTFKEDKIAFEDYAGRKSAFNDFIFDKTANFIDNSITVTIDYIDKLGWYEDFKLKLTQVPVDNQTGAGGQDDYYSQDINLASTNEPQTIVLNEYEMYVRDKNFKYTYSLSCVYQGQLIVLKEETEPFSFTDTSGGVSEFYGFEFPKKADFINNTFNVRLDYKDDFNSFYSFTLHLFPSGVNAQYDFYLDKTTSEQTCTFDENQHWNFSLDYTYTYYLTYYDDYGEVTYNEDTDSFVFTDVQNRASVFNGVTFDGKYDMTTGMAPIQLDYQDDFGYLSDFAIRFYGPITNSGDVNPIIHYANGEPLPSIDDYQYSVDLVKTTEVQYINLYESGVPISAEGQFLYAITYSRKGETQAPFQSANKFYFDDPDALSEVRGITFVNGEANFTERSFVVQLDFDDDYGYFNNFELQVWDDDNGGWVERSLSKTTDPQTVIIDEFDEEDYKYPVDIVEGDLTYNLVYTSAETGDPATQYFFDNPQPLSFTNSLKSEFYGLETSYDFRREEPAGEARLPFRFNCVNDAEYFSAPELYITTVGNDEEILASIMFANEVMDDSWQYGSFSTSDPDFNLDLLTNGYEYNVMVAYQAKDDYNGPEQRITFSAGTHVFTLNEKQEIYHVGVDNYLTAGNWEVYTTVFANGAFDDFSNGEIIFQRADGNYAALAYDVTISEYMTVDLHSPKEYTVNEDDLQEYFSHPVNITFKYSKPGSNEIITLNCYSNYLFSISNQFY